MDQNTVIEIKERLAKIEILLNTEVDTLKRRVTKLESNQEWLVRLVVGAVAGALIALVL